jgi:hypothetical protein
MEPTSNPPHTQQWKRRGQSRLGYRRRLDPGRSTNTPPPRMPVPRRPPRCLHSRVRPASTHTTRWNLLLVATLPLPGAAPSKPKVPTLVVSLRRTSHKHAAGQYRCHKGAPPAPATLVSDPLCRDAGSEHICMAQRGNRHGGEGP